jgi:hypothetical protein
LGHHCGEGIRTHESTEITLIGKNDSASLYCSGNNEEEYNKANSVYNRLLPDSTFTGPVGGSGIGNAGRAVGTIIIKDIKFLESDGYGHKAHGIGGGSAKLTIENCKVRKARGGFVDPEVENN